MIANPPTTPANLSENRQHFADLSQNVSLAALQSLHFNLREGTPVMAIAVIVVLVTVIIVVAILRRRKSPYPSPAEVETYENEPAGKGQRQRLRKAGIQFDEKTISRRQARELYRDSPEQKARTARTREQSRKYFLEEVRKKGFSVPDDITQDDLNDLLGSSVPDPDSLRSLHEDIDKLAAEGFRVSVPTYVTVFDVEMTKRAIEEVYEIRESLPSRLKDLRDTGVLSRMPRKNEVAKLVVLISEQILAGSWGDTDSDIADLLKSIAPDIRIKDLE